MNDLERENQVADFYKRTSLLQTDGLSVRSPGSRPPGAVQTAAPLLVGGRLGDGPAPRGSTAPPWGHRGAGPQRLFPLGTIVGGRGQVNAGIVVRGHRSTASRGPGLCRESPAHVEKEAGSSPGETALCPQWIEKAQQCPGKKTPVLALGLTPPPAPCRGRGRRRSPESTVPGTCPRPTLRQTSNDNLPRVCD